MNTKKKTRIVLPLAGGLGNQLFQYAMALNFEKSDYEVKLETELGHPRLNQCKEPEITSLFANNTLSLLPKRAGSGIVSKVNGYVLRMTLSRRWYENLRTIRFLIRIIAEAVTSIYLKSRFRTWSPTDLGYCQIPKFENNTLINGYFQSYRWSKDVAIFRTLEKLHPKERSITREHFEILAQNERPLVIHIRLGDYMIEEKFGSLGIQYYSEALAKIWNPVLFEKIWVFSDEIDKAKEIIPIEFHKVARWFQDIDQSTAQTFQLMRFGHGYIIANSTFSWWAGYLSLNRSAQVICPKPWFKGIDEPTDLIPLHWTRISVDHNKH